MMEFMNAFAPLPAYPQKALRMLTVALAPFAPHIAEEAWERLGGTASIAYESFPAADPEMLVDDMVMIVVQVNGKVRGKWLMPKDQDQDAILRFIETQPQIAKHIAGVVTKVVYVPNKILNFVVDVS
jgi:leucyl-tRNA synthetase